MSGKQREEWLNSIWPDKLTINHSKVRECFSIESANYRQGIDSDYYENLYQSALYLFVIGDPEDAVLIFDAKMSNFDLGCGMDYQFMLGAGLDKTIAHAQSVNRLDMVDYLEGLREDPDLPDIEEWMKFRINYFGLATQQGAQPDAFGAG
ncbi:hypothetical protein [Bremerella sp. P1]|uniref:hypothetical protein n=1 Tax=Bremerella sp. P1 TaxID=3026424 RepID=UPI00236860DD|nr:hypothetical protein [Bremerella sp. P1]WDI41263.1 hypothetical protein PSR63_22615 [Bremerella sp. P1]